MYCLCKIEETEALIVRIFLEQVTILFFLTYEAGKEILRDVGLQTRTVLF